MRAFVSALAVTVALAAPAAGQDAGSAAELEARVWLDRGDEPVLQRGDQVRVYYQTSLDAFTAIFRIDTDGAVRLLSPAHPGGVELTAGDEDYRLLFPEEAGWRVYDDPGVGYYFIIAAQQPLDFSAFRFIPEEDRWDLGDVAARVYEDPYLAIDDFVAVMIPDWEVSLYTLDFISYSVGEEHSYPRFLSYECHGERSYNSSNPYSYACTDFRVVVWDDPYYYPAVRYSGTRAVFPVPLRNRPRYTVVNRKPGEGWSPLVRFREPPPLPARGAQFKEPDVARGIDRLTPPRQTKVAPSAGVASRRSNAGSVPTRRPSTAPVAREGSSRVIQSRPTKPARARPSSGSVSTRRATGSARAGPTRRTPTSATPTRERPYSGVRKSSGTARPSLLRRLNTAVQNTAGSRAKTGRSTRSMTRPQPARTGSGASRSRPTRATFVRPPTRSSPVARPPARTRSRPATSRPAAAAGARPKTARVRPSISSRPTSTRSSPPARPTVRARATRPPPRRGGRGGS